MRFYVEKGFSRFGDESDGACCLDFTTRFMLKRPLACQKNTHIMCSANTNFGGRTNQ